MKETCLQSLRADQKFQEPQLKQMQGKEETKTCLSSTSNLKT